MAKYILYIYTGLQNYPYIYKKNGEDYIDSNIRSLQLFPHKVWMTLFI